MSESDLKAQLEALQLENDELKAKIEKKPRLKVSQKGAIQINGIRRFPITFYKREWEIIYGLVDQINTFVSENENDLS